MWMFMLIYAYMYIYIYTHTKNWIQGPTNRSHSMAQRAEKHYSGLVQLRWSPDDVPDARACLLVMRLELRFRCLHRPHRLH